MVGLTLPESESQRDVPLQKRAMVTEEGKKHGVALGLGTFRFLPNTSLVDPLDKDEILPRWRGLEPVRLIIRNLNCRLMSCSCKAMARNHSLCTMIIRATGQVPSLTENVAKGPGYLMRELLA
ncbi:hypothetical protein H6P81_001895 [Aristolochia fimbriata]|uniref:Uncharacterized protein n=1 Tax=Aristolochia fimbriata TaxID=158543 RepID=A0AAV7F894_ARIFI|nr:hypothetical protein H6P81_001895 [Aristolochia fimbriata]